MSFPARVLLFLVRVYQSFFSALMPSACKFYPSCSHYGAEAVRVHGARRGSWLALKRIARCHPFSRGGVDLVPDAPAEAVSIGCHSERSEESLFDLSPTRTKKGEILRFAQNDNRSIFSAVSKGCTAESAASASTEFSTSNITEEVQS